MNIIISFSKTMKSAINQSKVLLVCLTMLIMMIIIKITITLRYRLFAITISTNNSLQQRHPSKHLTEKKFEMSISLYKSKKIIIILYHINHICNCSLNLIPVIKISDYVPHQLPLFLGPSG